MSLEGQEKSARKSCVSRKRRKKSEDDLFIEEVKEEVEERSASA